ncbi:bifunctional protein-disulfide isomerase/oxidoreductase DsbC [Yersinia pestis]|uniref:Thiol:disulfide interchange protein n=12 Tax=Yersinia pseudotuberculosis complex TaxID=1649845 RepID=A0AAX2I1X8_YERPE|nr:MULTISPECIES: bifunctional protein-disulfide isomerase/oxidoreductase DsbC [Yersinia pseudotuberculosis complex]EDR33309.1 thiol:disulfide interchange protein DsbC [Yersinia pestis biovar Orientalis str. IP275]ERP76703.1 protein-disulfide isomerase [Yersinia pestis S3]ERP77176.1 protein-disulfide isomerase [Yersinia pestis 24H]AAM86825.1 protein disulfide isomerase II [Yersinia pestis KIM10+]AAS63738.1 thiol:disulfide interchange protein (DsbC) [Yersinia pestis biovar Microtus str. 91001]
MKKSLLLLPMLMAALSGVANADDSAIQQTLKKLDIQQADIQPSPIPGISTVMTESGVLYISADGKHLLQGPLYDVSGDQPINVTNQALLKKLEALSSEMIVYKAPEEKHVITVFTDITCGYCRKLHEQMKDYNALGITVRYLAFPRQGLSSQAEKDMRSIWCMADRNKAFDDAMKNNDISPATCKTDISKHYQLGVQFGIQGTPAIVLQNGTIVPGYQGPKEMLQMLNAHQASLKAGG